MQYTEQKILFKKAGSKQKLLGKRKKLLTLFFAVWRECNVTLFNTRANEFNFYKKAHRVWQYDLKI